MNLQSPFDGRVSIKNSSNVTLGIGGVFTGTSDDIMNVGVVIVTVFSDTASATNGLSVQFSGNGTNWDIIDTYTIPANTGKTFSFQPSGRLMRIVYTNGGIAQTSFRLNTYLKTTYVKPSSHRIQDMITSDDDAELVKAVMTGQKPNGDFVDFKATRLGNFPVSLEEYQGDAFGRLRVSEPYTLFDSSLCSVTSNSLFWSSLINGTGSGVYDRTTSKYTLTTTTAGDYSIRQTKQRFKYQPGKALVYGEVVLTPKGFVKIEELNVGEYVFDGNGDITKIKGIADWENRESYRLTFDDGSYVDADEEHEWNTIVRQNSKKGELRTISTKDMLKEQGNYPKGFGRWRIPASPVLEIEDKEVKIDPYTLGCILGDGYICKKGSVSFTTYDTEILDNLKCENIYDRKKDYAYGLNGLYEHIRYYNLEGHTAENKFVPDDYKYNSKEVRLAVLRGLMDTDGTVDKRDGTSYFCTISDSLADDIEFLVRSLGGQVKRRKKASFYRDLEGNEVECKDAWIITIIININPFKLFRKAVYWKQRERISFDRYVHSIESIGKKKTRCIEVESQEHTYLTRGHVVTHNSHMTLITGLLNTEAGQLKRVGLIDYDNIGLTTITNAPQNGVCFTNYAGVLSFCIYNNGTMTESVSQASWNIDNCDGTGRSGFSLNINSTNIFFIDMEWLGVGAVRCGFVADNGQIVVAHQFKHASNLFTDVYMRTANLPVSYSITSTAGAGSMKQICSSVISEGGFNPQGITTAIRNTSPISISNGQTALVVGIRLKEDSFEFTVEPTFLSILTTTGADSLWTLSINPTFSGTAPIWADLPNSECEFATGSSNLVTSYGIIVAQGSFSNNSDNFNSEISTALKIGKGLDSVQDQLWLSITSIGNETYYGIINFKQLI